MVLPSLKTVSGHGSIAGAHCPLQDHLQPKPPRGGIRQTSLLFRKLKGLLKICFSSAEEQEGQRTSLFWDMGVNTVNFFAQFLHENS
jgi:hypothetical protein